MKKPKEISSYAAKLKDPRWQRKRLEVMECNDFACEHCGDTESTLNVHHKAYKKNADPWDYEIEELACLCDDCHEAAHHLMAMVDEELFRFRTDPNYGDERLLGYLQGAMLDGPFPVVCRGAEHAEGIVDAWSRNLVARHHSWLLAEVIIDLSSRNKEAGGHGDVWPYHYRWNAAKNVVIQELEELLIQDPKRLIRFCEGVCGEPSPVPAEVAEHFINQAKQSMSTALVDSIKAE